MGDSAKSSPSIYEIRIEGELGGRWSEWLNGLTITCQGQQRDKGEGGGDTVTTLTGPIADQAALRGLLSRLWDLNLTLVSLTRMAERPHRG